VRKGVKHIVSQAIKPFISRYLSKTRYYKHNGIRLEIAPEVFHPGFFFSTKLLLKYILRLDLKNKYFLELGAGNGLIAFSAACEGAIVTATDINSIAIKHLEKNRKKNNINIKITQSDLYKQLPHQAFDIIAVNPPYYKRNPQTESQHAWYCGENGDYFVRFFEGLNNYIHEHSTVLMILSEDCDIDMIKNIGTKYDFNLNLAEEKKVLWEILYIFEIKKNRNDRKQ